jgi:hypothetical protein
VTLLPPELSHGKPKVRFHQDWATWPSSRYAAMGAARCTAELTRRKVPFTAVAQAPGVLAPVRLPDGAGGVLYRTAAPAHERAHNPHDVFDCRLALALSDFSKILRARGVSEVLMLSAWRPQRGAPPGIGLALRHPGALAMDAARLGKDPPAGGGERTWLDVDRDFGGTLGAPVCGASRGAAEAESGASRGAAEAESGASRGAAEAESGASRGAAEAESGAPPPAAAARELRAIVCEAAAQHIFTSILTPNYDRAHKNHLHLEVTPGVQWQLVR